MAETGITKQRIISELSKSTHGNLQEYFTIGKQAVQQEGDFFQHLIAWNYRNGQIRDSKVALPIVGLAYEKDEELLSNSLAHLSLLGPRELLKGYRFVLGSRQPGRMRLFRKLIENYLHKKEREKYWDSFAIQHRGTLKELYALAHVKPEKERVNVVLYGRNFDKTKALLPAGSVFEAVANLKNMTPVEAAGTIMKFKIPFLIAKGALGKNAKDPALVLALIDSMTSTELITNTKILEELGIKTDPALRGAYDEALKKASNSKQNTLKTTQAIDSVKDETLKEKLREVQDKQISKLGGPQGNWLILADKSGSMSKAIEASRHISATMAKVCQGNVYLVFFDTSPVFVDVTGMSLDQVKEATKRINAGGGTSIGCGLNSILSKNIDIDGIAIVSDGDENVSPLFVDVYKKYIEKFGKDVPVYYYWCDGYSDSFSPKVNAAGIEMQTFDVHRNLDYYSLPNLAATMRASKYSLVDEIMETPLLIYKV